MAFVFNLVFNVLLYKILHLDFRVAWCVPAV